MIKIKLSTIDEVRAGGVFKYVRMHDDSLRFVAIDWYTPNHDEMVGEGEVAKSAGSISVSERDLAVRISSYGSSTLSLPSLQDDEDLIQRAVALTEGQPKSARCRYCLKVYEDVDPGFKAGDTPLCKTCQDVLAERRARDISDLVAGKLLRRGFSFDELLAEPWHEFADGDRPTRKELEEALESVKKEFATKFYQRGSSFFIKRSDEPPIEIGTRLWRPVYVNYASSTHRIAEECEFQKTEHGSWLVYAAHDISLSRSVWSALAKVYRGRGLKCFSSVQPPKDWTYFEVTGFSKTGRAVFVKPVCGTHEELIKQYPARAKLEEQQRPSLAATATPPPAPVVKKKPYICSGCARNRKGSPGYGRCVVCREETVPPR